VNNKKGNNHAKNPEYEHFIPRDSRSQKASDGLLPGKRPAQLKCYSSSVEFLLKARDEGENATPYGEPIIT
jgi:hypothetical protein